jgi:hypothetical protein
VEGVQKQTWDGEVPLRSNNDHGFGWCGWWSERKIQRRSGNAGERVAERRDMVLLERVSEKD